MPTIISIIHKHPTAFMLDILNSDLSCPILPPDHSVETLTTVKLGLGKNANLPFFLSVSVLVSVRKRLLVLLPQLRWTFFPSSFLYGYGNHHYLAHHACYNATLRVRRTETKSSLYTLPRVRLNHNLYNLNHNLSFPVCAM